MAVEQMNITFSPQMATFIRRKVKAGGFASVSEVVRSAVRRMQDEERREIRDSESRAEELMRGFTPSQIRSIAKSIRERIAEVERGEYEVYPGFDGAAQLAEEVIAQSRKSSRRKRIA